MNIIDSSGNYQFKTGTRTLDDSEHPVFQARIELALGSGQWLCAPGAGHSLRRYRTLKESQMRVEEFQKELLLYLDKYDPEVVSVLGQRGAVNFQLQIAAAALKPVPPVQAISAAPAGDSVPIFDEDGNAILDESGNEIMTDNG